MTFLNFCSYQYGTILDFREKDKDKFLSSLTKQAIQFLRDTGSDTNLTHVKAIGGSQVLWSCFPYHYFNYSREKIRCCLLFTVDS